jgi:ABC-type multidrug transport system fused ATPase/permease subunit
VSTQAAVPVWRVLFGYVRPFRWVLVAGAALSLVTGATGLALPLVVRELIDGMRSDQGVAGLLVLMTILVLGNAAIGAFGSYLLERTAESVVLLARRNLVSRLLLLRIPAVDAAEPGDLMSRVTADTTLLRQVTTGSLVSAVTSTLTLAATIVLMATLDPLLLAVTLGAVGIMQVVIRFVMPRISRAARKAQESVGAMGAALERALGALRTVKASGAEERERDRLHTAAADAFGAGVRAAKWEAVAGNIGGLAIQLAFITVIGLGGARVASGTIDIGTLVAFLLYLFYLMGPIRDLVNAATQYQRGAAAVTRIREVESLPAEEPGERVEPNGRPAAVTFDSVRFRYQPELPEVHHGVSFTVPAGGMTAFVGPSGAGKTTVFSLIERFYEPDDGQVRVDGTDVRDWPLASLRAAIGYVEQDAPVLSGTLRENLVFGAPHATDHDIEEILGTTRLAGMVSRLPDAPAPAAAARRGHLPARRGQRGRAPGHHRRRRHDDHRARGRPPAVHGHDGRPHRRHGRRPGAGRRHARRTGRRRPALCRTGRDPTSRDRGLTIQHMVIPLNHEFHCGRTIYPRAVECGKMTLSDSDGSSPSSSSSTRRHCSYWCCAAPRLPAARCASMRARCALSRNGSARTAARPAATASP